MQVLSLARCLTITEDGISHVARNLPKLRSLSLADIGTVTDASLATLAECCPKLEEMDLSHGGDGVTDAGVGALAALGMLQSINVMDCTRVTDVSIAMLLRECAQLTPATLKADVDATDGLLYQTALIEGRHVLSIVNPDA